MSLLRSRPTPKSMSLPSDPVLYRLDTDSLTGILAGPSNEERQRIDRRGAVNMVKVGYRFQ
jgi:hypothetical protein